MVAVFIFFVAGKKPPQNPGKRQGAPLNFQDVFVRCSQMFSGVFRAPFLALFVKFLFNRDNEHFLCWSCGEFF